MLQYQVGSNIRLMALPPRKRTRVALLTIRLVPDPILFRKARKVAKITAQHRKLASDMIETLIEHHGVGLAANQVGVLERLCVIQTPEMEEAMVLVNPEITHREGEREVEEGCLSVPGYRGMVVRAELIKARALDLSSKTFKLEADELLAQALEHEIDHLNGIMYMDHLVAHTSLYKVAEQADGSEEDARYEAEDAVDGHPVDGHEDASGHEHPHSPNAEPDAGFDAMHRQLHEMRGDTADSSTVETSNR